MSIDVSKINPGDTVTITATVTETSSDPEIWEMLRVRINGFTQWVRHQSIATHTPAKRPATYEEFAAMPKDAQRRWFDEMRPRRTVETWMRENDREPWQNEMHYWFWCGPLGCGKAMLPASVWAEMRSNASETREAAVSALRDALLKLKLIDE